MNISDSEGFWYLEKQYKIFVNDVDADRFTDSDDSKSPTELHNGISRDANLYFFTGNDLKSVYDLGRYVVDRFNYSNGEKDISVFDVYEGVKKYFDVILNSNKK